MILQRETHARRRLSSPKKIRRPLEQMTAGMKRVWRINNGALQINGELSAAMDVSIDGSFEGRVVLKDHKLSTGASSYVKADIDAKQVLVRGKLFGNIAARDTVVVARTARVNGDIRAGRVVLEDGAEITGRISTASLTSS